MLKPKFRIAKYIKNANKGEVTGTITYQDGTKKEFLYGDLSFKNSEGIGLNKQGKKILPIQQRELRVGDIVKIRDDIPMNASMGGYRNTPHWLKERELLKGKIAKIEETNIYGEGIILEDTIYWWPKEWLELVGD